MAGLCGRQAGRRYDRRRSGLLRRARLAAGGQAGSPVGIPAQRSAAPRRTLPAYELYDARRRADDHRPRCVYETLDDESHDSAQPRDRALGISLRDIGVGSLQRATTEGPGRSEIANTKGTKDTKTTKLL